MATKVESQQAQADVQRKVDEYIEKIVYSERYSDDEFEYRHVILPKPLFRMIPKHFFNPDRSGTLRILDEKEWRGIGITQSVGWEHYEVHTPEPHVLLFRRPKDYDERQRQANGRFGKATRKK